MDILLVEDDPETALYVTEGLQKLGQAVHWATTGKDGICQARAGHYALMIVDRMLPGMDGLSMVRMLRAESCDTPVLMLTTMSGLDDRVDGLNAGADDYLTKPFAMSELAARVNAIVRRTSRNGTSTRLKAGSLEMDLLERTVSREGRQVELQPQEFKLLEYLMQNAGRTITRMMLLENVWNLDFDPGTNIVESHMSRLRSKIDRGHSTEMIHTVRGHGYVVSP
ncbi:response regulator transcription factor [Rhizomicrobium electricum]|uniref:Response regulator transcription factor n=1 Tax=Rhizomicrobium electricum TaxID=480070 RepID=A0ABP3QA42_9PROT|nr:response regulator transcription factor [Rhizomicrobium electricum]NIJ46694.1 two-component system OmpR family response regulator [Rhizomicrobium electricum]